MTGHPARDVSGSLTTPRAALAQARRLVVKVGSALVTNDGAGLDTQRLSE